MGLGLLGAIALGVGVGLPVGAIAIEPMMVRGGLAIELVQGNQDSKKAEADRLLERGIQEFRVSQFREALQSWETALGLYRELGNRQGEAASLGNLGVAYFSLGQYERAIDSYNQSLTLARETGDHQGEASSLNNLGNAYLSLGQYERAIDSYDQSLTLVRETGDHQGEASSLGNLGLAYFFLGQYERAIDFHSQYRTLAREIGDRRGEAKSLGNLGIAYDSLGQYERAIELHHQSLEIKREIGDRQGEANSLGNLGSAYYSLNQYERAIDSYNQSLTLAREIGDRRGEASSLNNLGNAYRSLGQYERAIVQFREALALNREIKSRYGERITLANLGRSFREIGQTDTALALFKQAVNVTESIREDNTRLDQSSQQSYADVIADDYRELADLLLTQGRALEAQEVLDLLAVQEIRDYNQNTRSVVRASGDIGYTAIETEIRDQHDSIINLGLEILRCQDAKNNCKNKLSDLNKQRTNLIAEFNETTKAIAERARDRAPQEDGFQRIAGLGSSARKLVEQKAGTLFINTFIDIDPNNPKQGTLWLLWVGPGGIANAIQRDIDPTELANTVLKFRQILTNSAPYDPNEFQALSQQLHRWIIDPLQDELDKNQIQHLIFRLDRELRYIPMAALHNGNSYLIERYTVANIINAAETNATARLNQASENPSILALGASDNHGEGALPHVPGELDAIVQERDRPDPNGGLYPGDSFLNDAFTFDTLQSNLYDRQILHIATHGNFSPTNAFGTYLRLGNGDRLPLADIQTLSDLGNIHLAVLSACETGLSGNPDNLAKAAINRPDGREISSLLYAFTANDQAKAVLSTLWKVDDGYTRIFMETFYRNLARHPELTKAEVLRKTQLAFIQNKAPKLGDADGTHPYHWAPFTLTGNSW